MKAKILLDRANQLNNNNAIHEARQVEARLEAQNITDYYCVPNDSRPEAIIFTYNGSLNQGNKMKSARDQYNSIAEKGNRNDNPREAGTFVSMQPILETMLQRHSIMGKHGRYVRVPIQPRTRAQPGIKARNNGRLLWRTYSENNTPPGKWFVVLRNFLFAKHNQNFNRAYSDNNKDIDQDEQENNEIVSNLHNHGIQEDIQVIANNSMPQNPWEITPINPENNNPQAPQVGNKPLNRQQRRHGLNPNMFNQPPTRGD